jgi:hypothetical protein
MGWWDDMIWFIYLAFTPALYFDRGVPDYEMGRGGDVWHFLGMVQRGRFGGAKGICIHDWIGLMSERASLDGFDVLYHFFLFSSHSQFSVHGINSMSNQSKV